jgi:AAT family amino acid transporter
MVPKTVDEVAQDHERQKTMIQDIRWSPNLGWGLGTGAVVGVAFYFVTVWLLPVFYSSITVIK